MPVQSKEHLCGQVLTLDKNAWLKINVPVYSKGVQRGLGQSTVCAAGVLPHQTSHARDGPISVFGAVAKQIHPSPLCCFRFFFARFLFKCFHIYMCTGCLDLSKCGASCKITNGLTCLYFLSFCLH